MAMPELRQEQISALSALNGKNAYGIFARMGAGKTAIALRDAQRLYERGAISRLLITAPPGVTTQWIREQAPIWLGCRWVGLEYKSPSSRTKAYVEEAREKLATKNALVVVVIHFEAFVTDAGISFVQWFLKEPCAWVIDESTKIKNPRAQRTKTIHKLAPLAKYRRILSGTPITRGYEDLWAQISFLDRTVLGRSFYTFRTRYCELAPVYGAPAGAMKIVGYQRVNELMHKISGVVFQTKSTDLPQKTYIMRPVLLTPEQRRYYEMIERALDDFPPEDFDINNVLTQMVRLMQVLSGFVVIDEEVKVLKSNRAAVVADVIEETDGKAIVWHRFARDADTIRDELARRCPDIPIVEYSGRVSTADRVAALDVLRATDERVIMIAQLQAASHGLDCPQVSTSVYYSGTFDAEVRWQSEDRQRPGLMFPGVYVDLVVADSIDGLIIENNRNKWTTAETARRFLAAIRARRGES
jgi:SNF2 family DNA or RNA helicase